MKIVFLADSFLLDKTSGVNGTQVQMYNLAFGLKRRGMDVHYIASTGKWVRDHEVVSGINVHWLRAANGAFSWVNNLRSYFRILNQLRPDAVYQRGRSYLTFVSARSAKKNGKKFIWGSNGEDGCEFWKNIKRLQSSGRSLWKKFLLFPNAFLQDVLIHEGVRGASSVVNQTHYQRERLWLNFRKRGFLIPSCFPLPEEEKIRSKEKIVLWLANLLPAKQPEIFLRLAERCRELPGWKFILAGGTNNQVYFQKICNQARDLPNVEILGAIPFEESNSFFARASLFVNTSVLEAEGLPNTFIQSWLKRTPVLSLIHDPNGWINKWRLGFCANGDLDFFYKKGVALLDGDCGLKSMGENCLDFARKTFAKEKIIDIYIDLFKS